jgi:hypothetical protein
MLAKLDTSLEEYRALAKLASPAYRQATDLGDWYRWDSTQSSLEQEVAFYHEQKDLATKGSELVYIGLDGPMNNADNAFHWLLEHDRRQANWSAQSYRFGESLLRRAKLVIVYDLDSPEYRNRASELRDWVRQGGKMLIWDERARASSDPLLAGIRFESDSSHRPPSDLAFDGGDHPLLRGIAGIKYRVDAECSVATSIQKSSPEWRELAYTVSQSVNTTQFYTPYETVGPRWTSLMNPARLPLALARKYGAGEVVIAQFGTCNIPPKPQVPAGQVDQAPIYLRELTKNLVMWAQGTPASTSETGKR